MAAPSLTYTLTNGTTADASQVMQDLNDIINGITDGTKDLSISALTCAGTLTANGHVNLGNASADDLTITASLASNLVPKTTGTYNIGSADLGMAGLYLAASSDVDTARIIAAAHTADRTYTIPDLGADGTFAFLGSAQTFSGSKTFSAEITATGGMTSGTNIVATGIIQGTISNNSGSAPAQFFNSNATANSSTRVARLVLSGGNTMTNAVFCNFEDGDGTIGTITAASATTVAYNTSSDARLKDEVEDYTDGLATLEAVKPRRFRWKKSGEKDVGFIAQELQQTLPGLVAGDESGDPKDTPMGVDYGRLTPVLAAAIKELHAKVKLLEAKSA